MNTLKELLDELGRRIAALEAENETLHKVLREKPTHEPIIYPQLPQWPTQPAPINCVCAAGAERNCLMYYCPRRTTPWQPIYS